MKTINKQFTSTGHKFFLHQEAMQQLRDGKGMPIVSHIMLTDICQHKCAFCSVATREGNRLTFQQVRGYLEQLVPLGLKAVILSGGGNPILYKDKETSKIGILPGEWNATFNDVVKLIKGYGLEIGLITNGAPLKEYERTKRTEGGILVPYKRKSWITVEPEVLDMLTWVRISMSGLDHRENEVFVPDIDPSKTTLGFSYILHDIYVDPADKHHGKVSTPEDLVSAQPTQVIKATERLRTLEEQFNYYLETYNPVYLRLLPNCLQPQMIPERCEALGKMADRINLTLGRETAFVQFKPPQAPHRCFLGYPHPVLNTDGFVYPCDSCVLNAAAGHKFANPWRICSWDKIGEHYSQPIRSLLDPEKLCPGCVFTASNELLGRVVDGMETPLPTESFNHPNFV